MSRSEKLISSFVESIENIVSFNDVFCGFIILLAIVSFLLLHKNVKRNIKDLKNFIAKSEEIKGDLSDKLKIVLDKDLFKGNKFLISTWESYTKYARNNLIQGKLPDISNHFSKFNIIDMPGKRKIAEIIPGTLTALGILGTFLGLQSGVSKIEVEPIEKLKESIDLLTKGMSLAFITSIVGIIASTIWSYIDRKRYKYYIQVLDNFYNVFNTKYPVFNNSSFYNEMLELQKETTNSIKKLATDFSLKFSEIMTNAINQSILPAIDQTINKIVERDINPNIQTMNDIIDNFTVNASENQAGALKLMVNDFISKLNDVVKTQFDDLEKTIKDFTKWHIETKSSLDELVNEIKESASNQQEINISAEELITKYTKLFDKFNSVNSQVAEGLKKIESTVYELNNLSSFNAETLESLNDIYKKINSSYEHVENNLGQLIEIVDNSLKGLVELKNELENSSKVFSDNLGQGLNATFNIFDQSLSEISKRLSGTILEVQQTVEELPVAISFLSDELKKNVNKLSATTNEINGIYKEINMKLKEKRSEVLS